MASRKPLTDDDGEVRELTAEDLKHFRPAAEVLSPSLCQKLGIRLTKAAPTAPARQRTTIRLSRDVLDRFRATGKGWQSRVDGALREWLEHHPAE